MGIIKKKIPCLFHISSHILFILPGDIIAIAGGWDCALKGEASMPIKSSGRIVPPGWAPLQPKQSVLSLIV